jgi:low affinity Fe/Cu permease
MVENRVFIYHLIITTIFVFIINIPFGYWRSHVKKFSLQWILAVHIPVPLIIMLRLMFHLGFVWYTYLFLVASFFLGQKLGGILHQKQIERHNNVSACLFIDIKRNFFTKTG